MWHAYDQITNRYQRDIPELFKYNAFCVISDGVNNKAGSFFAAYEFYYAWRKTDGSDLVEKDGSTRSPMIQGLFHQTRLLDVIRNFIYLPDTSRKEETSAATRNTTRQRSCIGTSSSTGSRRRRQGRHLLWRDRLR